jgi:hypothetical protein
MRFWSVPSRLHSAGAAAIAVGLLVTLPACTLTKDDPGVFNGPSETGLSAELQAVPDTVNADGGRSSSLVLLTLRDQTGAPAGGRAVYFRLLHGDGRLVEATASPYVGPLQQDALVLATGQDGRAQIVYESGEKITTVEIGVRAFRHDATREYLSKVEIIQR